jgi:hypothetical protein
MMKPRNSVSQDGAFSDGMLGGMVVPPVWFAG